MATNIYTMRTVDGKQQQYRRAKKQGAPKKDAAIKDIYVCITLLPASLRKIDANARAHGMSRSAWLELAGVLYYIG